MRNHRSSNNEQAVIALLGEIRQQLVNAFVAGAVGGEGANEYAMNTLAAWDLPDAAVGHEMLEQKTTNRGFSLIEFTDRYGVACSLQKSSLATEDAIWLGCDDADPKIMAKQAAENGVATNETTGWVPFPVPAAVSMTTRMHLTQDQVATLLPILAHFAATGDLLATPPGTTALPLTDAWVNVDERMPQGDVACLVVHGNDDVRIDYWSDEGWCLHLERLEHYECAMHPGTPGRPTPPTYWQPLPAAPSMAGDTPALQPSTLGQQVAKAQAEMATWTPEQRASVQLQGGDAPARKDA